ncbi:hypothetical protein CRYUN_Cryun39dG0083300 [Craigia yunnanensis]
MKSKVPNNPSPIETLFGKSPSQTTTLLRSPNLAEALSDDKIQRVSQNSAQSSSSRVRLAYWCKGKWPFVTASVNDLFHNPFFVSVKSNKLLQRPLTFWSCPPPTAMMLNLNIFSFRKLGPAAIGGSFWYHSKNIEGIFSMPIGVEDSNFVEFMAIRVSPFLFSCSSWASSHTLIIKRDSNNVIRWVYFHSFVPWQMKYISNHIERLKFSLKGLLCNHIFREANSTRIV